MTVRSSGLLKPWCNKKVHMGIQYLKGKIAKEDINKPEHLTQYYQAYPLRRTEKVVISSNPPDQHP